MDNWFYKEFNFNLICTYSTVLKEKLHSLIMLWDDVDETGKMSSQSSGCLVPVLVDQWMNFSSLLCQYSCCWELWSQGDTITVTHKQNVQMVRAPLRVWCLKYEPTTSFRHWLLMERGSDDPGADGIPLNHCKIIPHRRQVYSDQGQYRILHNDACSFSSKLPLEASRPWLPRVSLSQLQEWEARLLL
jgi:hypothetical protein